MALQYFSSFFELRKSLTSLSSSMPSSSSKSDSSESPLLPPPSCITMASSDGTAESRADAVGFVFFFFLPLFGDGLSLPISRSVA